MVVVTRLMTALIIAFDGILVDTLDIRADALLAALNSHGSPATRDTVRDALPGRSLFESVELLVGHTDQTLADLVTLQTQRAVSTRMAHGVSLAPNARDWIEARRATGSRLVLRADSIRRDVDLVLEQTEMALAFSIVRCADDLPRTRGASSLGSAYTAITRRLDALGVSGPRTAFERGAYARDGALKHVSHVHAAHDFSLPSSDISLYP